MTADLLLSRIAVTTLLLFVTSIAGGDASLFAQGAKEDAPDAAAEAAADTEEAEEAEEVDPLAVPEGASAEELFAHINKVKSTRGRDIQSVVKAAKAAVAAAAAIRELDDVSDADEIKAVNEQMAALAFLVRYDPPSRAVLADLLEALKNDERPKFQKIGIMEAFKAKIAGASSASEAEQLGLIAELKELIGEDDFDRDAYSLMNMLAKGISGSKSVNVAASLYEEMAARMTESSDAMLQERAPKMLGAARRIRLPGNFMEINATTTAGDSFDWESYRGKVVLVDFWASWCGPCRAEIPNMKRNLELYGEDGFEIVGVNLDRTLEACEKYVESEELTWTNLMSENQDERSWDNPLATYYGITAIPTAILVDQEGKVVSLKAHGKELDRLLGELLGPPKQDAGQKLNEEEVAEYERELERSANESE